MRPTTASRRFHTRLAHLATCGACIVCFQAASCLTRVACRRVDLSHNKIGSSGKYQLPESMGTLFSLEWLSLDNNKCVCAQLVLDGNQTHFCAQPHRSLRATVCLCQSSISQRRTQCLDRSSDVSCSLQHCCGWFSALFRSRYLNKLVNLSCLIACNNQLEEFPAALCTMNSIQTLDLAANRLRDLPYQVHCFCWRA